MAPDAPSCAYHSATALSWVNVLAGNSWIADPLSWPASVPDQLVDQPKYNRVGCRGTSRPSLERCLVPLRSR